MMVSCVWQSAQTQPQTATDSHRQPQTATDTNSHRQPQTQTATDSHRQPQTATDSHRQSQTATYSHRQPQTATDSQTQTATDSTAPGLQCPAASSEWSCCEPEDKSQHVAAYLSQGSQVECESYYSVSIPRYTQHRESTQDYGFPTISPGSV